LRCDCGHDFESKTVEKPYFTQELPREIRTWLIFMIVCGGVLVVALATFADMTRLAEAAAYTLVVYWCYVNLVRKKNWARVVLILLTFPVGLTLFGSDVRLYCLQVEDGSQSPEERVRAQREK